MSVDFVIGDVGHYPGSVEDKMTDKRKARMRELEKILGTSLCGKCLYYRTSGCPKAKLCTARFLRIHPAKDAAPCSKYKPSYTMQKFDEEYIYLKMHDNLT